jgi:hypothetical protein
MASDNIETTYSWLRAAGFMKGPKMTDLKEWTVDEMTAINQAFSAGNYGNAYESTDLGAFDELDAMSAHEHAAFVIGFYSSYSLDEIDDRELFDEAYFSAAGRYVVNVAGYADDRSDEYAAEEQS